MMLISSNAFHAIFDAIRFFGVVAVSFGSIRVNLFAEDLSINCSNDAIIVNETTVCFSYNLLYFQYM